MRHKIIGIAMRHYERRLLTEVKQQYDRTPLDCVLSKTGIHSKQNALKSKQAILSTIIATNTIH